MVTKRDSEIELHECGEETRPTDRKVAIWRYQMEGKMAQKYPDWAMEIERGASPLGHIQYVGVFRGITFCPFCGHKLE